MARPFQLLSLLSRLGAPSVALSFSSTCVRFASRGTSKTWLAQSHDHTARSSHGASRYSDRMSDEEVGLEDVEDKLQTLVDEGRKRQRTVKYHILRRQMTPSGAPQRKLTWDAIEQIRYLKQEQPEEWTVERLAEGFSVSPDVILRVLRTKFVPSPERKAKQDAKSMAGLGQQVLPSGDRAASDRLKLPGIHATAVLPPGRGDDAVVPASDKALMLRSTEASKSLVPATSPPIQPKAGISKDTTVETSGTMLTEDEESWDGQVFTEEELEQYIQMEKPSPVVQVGSDFFDVEGDFLYRI
ncbi:neugrin [Labrus mixtus]|uniref:neugrin n=1 Tax=Labrus mixtus TaxID=508554 RepID=UPI0029C01206|nr:neugrin [Labrus mixtus]